MGTTTRINAYRALAKRLYRGKLDVITGTASATTSTTSLKDATRLDYSSGDLNAYDRCFVYAMAAADASTRGFTRVTEGGYAVTGTLALDPALTGLATTDLYVITQDHPDVLFEAINEVQRNDYVEAWFPLSIHIVQNDCNDMEASTLATDYELTTGAAAATIETTIVFKGRQSLQLTCSAANEYAALKSVINVPEEKNLHAAIMCSVTQGDDAAFRIWDSTTDEEIDSATSDEPAWMNLQIPVFAVPSGCEQIDVRLEGISSGDVTYWDQFQVWADGGYIYPLPSYITSDSQLLDVRAFSRGIEGPAADNDFRPNERMSYPLDWEWESEAPGSMRIWVEGSGSARPYLKTLRPRPELSLDSDTTTANSDWLVAMAEKTISEPEEASELLRSHVAAQLAVPRTRVSRRFGVSIR